jgi:hypothetical protein
MAEYTVTRLDEIDEIDDGRIRLRPVTSLRDQNVRNQRDDGASRW